MNIVTLMTMIVVIILVIIVVLHSLLVARNGLRLYCRACTSAEPPSGRGWASPRCLRSLQFCFWRQARFRWAGRGSVAERSASVQSLPFRLVPGGPGASLRADPPRKPAVEECRRARRRQGAPRHQKCDFCACRRTCVLARFRRHCEIYPPSSAGTEVARLRKSHVWRRLKVTRNENQQSWAEYALRRADIMHRFKEPRQPCENAPRRCARSTAREPGASGAAPRPILPLRGGGPACTFIPEE